MVNITENDKLLLKLVVLYGGESGIRTLGEFPHTAFRVLHLRPLGQLSIFVFVRGILSKDISFVKKILLKGLTYS